MKDELGKNEKVDLLNKIVKYSSDIIAVYDENWFPKYLSPSVENILGYKHEDFLNSQFYQEILDSVSDMQEEEVDGVVRYRYRCENSEGEKVWLESTVDTLFDEAGRLLGHLGVTRNITENVNLKKKLEGSLEKERELNKIKSQFISIVSHELKNPLATVKSSIEICSLELEKHLKNHQAYREFSKQFRRINNQLDRMNSLMVNLLNLEKINQGIVQVDKRPEKINSWLKLVLEEWLSQGELAFQTDLGDDFEFPLDVTLSNQVIINIVDNALKYGGKGTKPVVRCAMEAENLVVSVRDFGKGISEEDKAHLFESFFRGAGAEGFIPGSGLGLMIAKKFTELQNGKLYFESKVGEGTSFFIEFAKLSGYQ